MESQNFIEREVQGYALSRIEKDTLFHFPEQVSGKLLKAFHGFIMVFHPLLPALWNSGVRIRILPEGWKFTDLEECPDDFHNRARGVWFEKEKLVIVEEEAVLFNDKPNMQYYVPIHEMAHAIHDLLLSRSEKKKIEQMYQKETEFLVGCNEYRLMNVKEFFAESFCYFMTPTSGSEIVEASTVLAQGRGAQGNSPNEMTLKELNPEMFNFLQRRFKGVVRPEIFSDSIDGKFPDDTTRFEHWFSNGLYLPVCRSSKTNF